MPLVLLTATTLRRLSSSRIDSAWSLSGSGNWLFQVLEQRALSRGKAVLTHPGQTILGPVHQLDQVGVHPIVLAPARRSS